MIPQKDIQQDCLEFYDNVVQAYMEEYPGSEIASIFMEDLITSYTCANCWHFTATVTKETAIQIKVINASTHVSFENLLWNTMSGSSDYRERKCPECNNGNIFNEIIFNGEAHSIKVFHLLRACDTNLKPNRLKVKIPFEVDLKSFYLLLQMPVILFIFCLLQQLLSDIIFAIYLQKTTQSYATIKQLQRKQRKQLSGTDHFKRVCTSSFIYNEMIFRKKHLKAYFTHPWKIKMKFEICILN